MARVIITRAPRPPRVRTYSSGTGGSISVRSGNQAVIVKSETGGKINPSLGRSYIGTTISRTSQQIAEAKKYQVAQQEEYKKMEGLAQGYKEAFKMGTNVSAREAAEVGRIISKQGSFNIGEKKDFKSYVSQGYSPQEAAVIVKQSKTRVTTPDPFGRLEQDFLAQKSGFRKEERELKDAQAAYEVSSKNVEKIIQDFNEQFGGKSLGQAENVKAQEKLKEIEKLKGVAKSSEGILLRKFQDFKTAGKKYETLQKTTLKDKQLSKNLLNTLIINDTTKKTITNKDYTTQIGKPRDFEKDLSQEEFEKEIKKEFDSLKKETSFEQLVFKPAGLKTRKLLEETRNNLTPIWNIEGNLKNFASFNKNFIGNLYDYGTDILGFGAKAGTPTFYTKTVFPTFAFEQETIAKSYEQKGFINPYATTLQDLKKFRKQEYKEEIESDFYLGKQIAETGLFLAGGSLTTVAQIGSVARTKTPEEAIIPFALGGAVRLFSPLVGAKLGGGIVKTNKLIDQKLSKMFTSKLPVTQNVLVPSKFGNLLTESAIAKTALIGGSALEIGSLGFIPLSQKREYIRQVGLYNALVPIGYKFTDIGIAATKFVGIKSVYSGSKLLGKITKKDLKPFDIYSPEELMYPGLAEKFSKTGGGTPTFRGTEREMLSLTQGYDTPGTGRIFKEFGLDPKDFGIGGGLRSIPYKAPDIDFAGRGYYETMFDYYSDVLHPIALKNVGLKNRLFRPPASFYDRFSFSPTSPSIKFTVAKRGVAVSLFDDVPLTKDIYEELNKFYGYKPMDFSFSDDIFFKKAKIEKGLNLGDFEYEKILRKGRPIKTGDFFNAGFSDDVFDSFVPLKDPAYQDIQGFISSRPRAFMTTGEREFGIPMNVKDVRIPAFTPARKIARKLGFSDFYVDVGFEYVPGTYRKIVDKPLLMLDSGQRLLDSSKITGKDRAFLQPEALTKKSSNYLDFSQNSIIPLKKGTAKGGYTMELEKMFGSKKNPLSSFFEKAIYPKPIRLSKNTYTAPKAPKYYFENYTPLKAPKYNIKKYDLPIYTPPKQPRIIYTPPKQPSYDLPRYDEPRYPDYKVPTYKTPSYEPPRITIYGSPKIKPPRKLIVPQMELPLGKDKPLGTFHAYVRKNNNSKWVKVTKKSLPYNSAFNFGLKVADNTVARTVKLEPASKNKLVFDDPFINDAKFRRRKTGSKIPGKEVIFTEKNQFAIDTLGEKQGLKAGKYLKQRGGLPWAF